LAILQEIGKFMPEHFERADPKLAAFTTQIRQLGKVQHFKSETTFRNLFNKKFGF
jgi:hypothetical protein